MTGGTSPAPVTLGSAAGRWVVTLPAAGAVAAVAYWLTHAVVG